jgi:hypothetical protein
MDLLLHWGASVNYIQRITSDVSDLGKYIIVQQLNRAATSPSVIQPSYVICRAKGAGKGSKSIGEINQLNKKCKFGTGCTRPVTTSAVEDDIMCFKTSCGVGYGSQRSAE